MTCSTRLFAMLLLSLLAVGAAAQQYEADYVELIHRELGGRREVAVASGYVDLLTGTHAIEVEFASKWKQSIGQALWYGLQTGKEPGVVLVKKDRNSNKYVVQFGSALQYAGLEGKIKLWVWPDDFGGGAAAQPRSYEYRAPARAPAGGHYWLTTSSKRRHNSGCRYYRKTRGRLCEKGEGIACKICGG